jgi:hypothetical protein
MSSVKIAISLPELLLKTIDDERGLVPRSTYIVSLIQRKKSTPESN